MGSSEIFEINYFARLRGEIFRNLHKQVLSFHANETQKFIIISKMESYNDP